MHIGRPIPFRQDRQDNLLEEKQAQSGLVLAAILAAVFATVVSIALATHGMTPPCGAEFAVSCSLG